MDFREILKDLSFEKNMTQGEVAKGCGLTPTCICQLETGARKPTGSTVIALANFFEVSSDYLLGLEDDFGARTTAPTVGAMHSAYSSEERRIIEQYRSLPKQLQELIRNQLEIYCAPETLNKSDKKV